jgi:hypothetical protein
VRTKHALVLRRPRLASPETCPVARRTVPGRVLALLVAVLTTAGLVTTATVRPASAAENDSICLSNANSYCLGIGPVEAAIIVEVGREIIQIILDHIGNDPQGDPEDEAEDESDPSLCLQDTGLRPGVDASWGPCGANGTVWIWVPHSDGYYLYSRYSVDNHVPALVLTVDPLSNGAKVFVAIGANPGGAYWQTFNYY